MPSGFPISLLTFMSDHSNDTGIIRPAIVEIPAELKRRGQNCKLLNEDQGSHHLFHYPESGV